MSHEERQRLAELWQSKSPVTQIAKVMGRSRSTITRELTRNSNRSGQYWPDTADRLSFSRRRRGCRLDKDEGLRDFVRTNLMCHGWTPEQIAGWLKHQQTTLGWVSHETIYSWLYKPAQKREKLWKYLPRHKAKRGPRKSRGAGLSRIPNRVSIHNRPKAVAEGGEFGHCEADLMSFQKGSQHSVVIRERNSMFTLSLVLASKKADHTAEKIIDLLTELPQSARKTLTLDNGGEFANHGRWLEELGLPSFFCDPYASWQKGGVENTNGRLRRDLPRKTNVKTMRKEDFDEVIENYNLTPRKKLGWRTPAQVFNQNLQKCALQS